MKKLFIITLLILCPQISLAEDEYKTFEMLTTPQDDEILLINNSNNEDDDSLIDGVNQNGENIQFEKIFEESNEDLTDNLEEEFKFFDLMGKSHKKHIEQSPLEQILKQKITRTDIPTFLLQEQLTYDYDKGPISETQFYAGYRGALLGNLSSGDYSTKYDNNVTEFGVYGKFKNPAYNFKFMLRPVPVKGLSYLDGLFGDIYIMYDKIPHHKIVAGYQRIQTGMEGGIATYILPFYARSQIARNFGNSRAISAKIVGNYNYADYSLSVGSSGRYIRRGMPGAETALWLNIKPFGSTDSKYGKLTLGAGVNAGHNDINYTVGSAYIGYKHKKLWTNFEVGIADGYNGNNGAKNNKATGYAFTAGWKFNPHLQLIGRIDQFDPNRNLKHDLKREYTAGINWFIKGQALKMMFNYVYCQNQNSHDSHKFIIATQVLL